MLIWYKMMHKFPCEHNIEHNRSRIRAWALDPKIIGFLSGSLIMLIQPLRVIKSYTNCDIIVVVMGIILSIIGNYIIF